MKDGHMDEHPEPRGSEEQQRHHIAERLAQAGFALPGNLVTRHLRCGKPGCRCKADPPQLHGPYHQWTRKVDGKTITRWVSDEQLARYQPWFANAQRLRELLTQLEALSLRIAERTEGWDPQPPPTGHRPRHPPAS
jgi:hypothetical protein